jgi:hypothetical protein
MSYAQRWHDEFKSLGKSKWKDRKGKWVGIADRAAEIAVEAFRSYDKHRCRPLFDNPSCYNVKTIATYLNSKTYWLPNPLEYWMHNHPYPLGP